MTQLTFEQNLTMGDLLVKHCRWKWYLGVGLKNKLKSSVSAATYLFSAVSRKNGSLFELGHRGFLTLMVFD